MGPGSTLLTSKVFKTHFSLKSALPPPFILRGEGNGCRSASPSCRLTALALNARPPLLPHSCPSCTLPGHPFSGPRLRAVADCSSPSVPSVRPWSVPGWPMRSAGSNETSALRVQPPRPCRAGSGTFAQTQGPRSWKRGAECVCGTGSGLLLRQGCSFQEHGA